MNFRADIYSPLQNLALWMGAWLEHEASFDDANAAWAELGGPHRLADADFVSAEVFAAFRQAYTQGSRLRLLLHGPGQPLALAPQAPIATLATQAGGALVIEQTTGDQVVFVGLYDAVGEHTDWTVAEIPGPTVSAPWLSPGDADTQLRAVTDRAAQMIAARNPGIDAPNPRLTVGSLQDYYDSPGLPPDTPKRSTGLIARANTVTAIMETTMQRHGIHEFDPELLALSQAIRQARMSAVDYALAEWGRRAG